MRHGKLREQLSLHLDGMLGAVDAARLEAHLEQCADCRSELLQLRRTVELLRELPPVEAPSHLVDRVIAMLRERESAPPSAARRFGVPLAAVGAGIAALFVIQGVEISLVLPGPVRWATVGSPAPSEDIPAAPADRGPAAESSPFRSSFPPHDDVAAFKGGDLLPPKADCLTPSEAQRANCARWYSWHLGLGLRDAVAFMAEMEAVPSRARERWIGELSDLALHSGSASVLARQLRATGDPRAPYLARHFERTSASR